MFPHFAAFAESGGFLEAWEPDGLLGVSEADWKEKTVGVTVGGGPGIFTDPGSVRRVRISCSAGRGRVI